MPAGALVLPVRSLLGIPGTADRGAGPFEEGAFLRKGGSLTESLWAERAWGAWEEGDPSGFMRDQASRSAHRVSLETVAGRSGTCSGHACLPVCGS